MSARSSIRTAKSVRAFHSIICLLLTPLADLPKPFQRRHPSSPDRDPCMRWAKVYTSTNAKHAGQHMRQIHQQNKLVYCCHSSTFGQPSACRVLNTDIEAAGYLKHKVVIERSPVCYCSVPITCNYYMYNKERNPLHIPTHASYQY